MPIRTTIGMTDVATALRLQSWFSPAFPIGGFSYSHGLEPAIDRGVVKDRAGLVAWLETLLRQGSARIDARFFAAAWRKSSDVDAATELAAEASAWLPTAELAQEAELQGDAFLSTVAAAWPHPAINAFRRRRSPSPRVSFRASTAPTSAKRCRSISRPSPRTSFRRASGSSPSARPTASAR